MQVTLTLDTKELVRILNAMLEVDYISEQGMSDGQRETYNRLYVYAHDLGCTFINGWWVTPKPQQSKTLLSASADK